MAPRWRSGLERRSEGGIETALHGAPGLQAVLPEACVGACMIAGGTPLVAPFEQEYSATLMKNSAPPMISEDQLDVVAVFAGLGS